MRAAEEEAEGWTRRALFGPGAALGGLVVGALILELGLRALGPPPHVQIVRPGSAELRLVDGVPVWRSEGSAARENADCAPRGEGERWLLLGSSILYGSGLSPEDSPGAQLQAALGPGHCVHNYAQPAFTFPAQAAVGQEALAALSPTQVIWEIWDNSPLRFVVAEGTAYNLHGYALGPDGLPALPGAPAGLNRWMLPRSRLWETLALRAAPPAHLDMEVLWAEFSAQALRPALEALLDQGLTPTLYLAPHLDHPFPEQLAEPRGPYAPVEAMAQELGIRALRGERLLAEQDVEAIRRDPCCHLNARGSHILAEALSIELTENPTAPAD